MSQWIDQDIADEQIHAIACQHCGAGPGGQCVRVSATSVRGDGALLAKPHLARVRDAGYDRAGPEECTPYIKRDR